MTALGERIKRLRGERELPGATRQMSPSFFMQKPTAFRHSYDWLYQLQRVSTQTLPPSVPALRS